jgi:8-oxo-dGTP pyrophosphatase MutT (NUDIX family)
MDSKHSPREVAVFVHRGDQMLVLHRTQEDYWHVVAGSLEKGETSGDAAARELQEETGIVAHPIDMDLEQTDAITERERPCIRKAQPRSSSPTSTSRPRRLGSRR